MMDEGDDGARIGVWTALGVVTLLLFGLIGGLAYRSLHHKAPAAAVKAGAPVLAGAAAGLGAGAGAAADAEYDGPLVGDLVGTFYFDSGSAALPVEGPAEVAAVQAAAQKTGERRLIISGFHDSTGDPARNAELAKERAKAVRAALEAAGMPLSRLQLRKPEQTMAGVGDDRSARRVEVRIAP